MKAHLSRIIANHMALTGKWIFPGKTAADNLREKECWTTFFIILETTANSCYTIKTMKIMRLSSSKAFCLEVSGMLENYKTIYEGGEGELTEKKSRFIATVRLVEKEEDALAFIEEMKKKYWDARHNCYAYSIGEHREFTRCSDDGEPSGTAGRPMLDVILGEDIYNVAVVVTRYFGGVLLGTGGLVRAYSGAVQAGLKESTVIEKHHGISLALTADYTAIGKLQYIAAENQLPILDTEYTDQVVMHLLVPNDQVGRIEKVITEATSGRVKMEKEKELYFADVNGEIKIFDH